MKVFISSLINGYEAHRQAASVAVRALGHEPVMAESFTALPHSSQIACLTGIREADLVLLVLVDRYGTPPPGSKVSPTHEEFLEARDTKPVLVFVQEGVDREPRQSEFMAEVQSWQTGYFRAGFKSPDELRDRISGALHGYELSRAAAPLDLPALREAALGLIPAAQRNQTGAAVLNLSVAGGPRRQILRPAELEAAELVKALHQQALFGEPAIFSGAEGARDGMQGDTLFLEQKGGGARVSLDEQGGIALRLPMERSVSARGGALFSLIEETVVERIAAAIAYSAWLMERIDPTQRLTHVAVAASIDASEHLGWRTRAEQDASPNSGQMRIGGNLALVPVCVDRPRATLRFDADRKSVV